MRNRLRGALSPRRLARRLWPPLLFLAILIGLWELALAVNYVSESILPHPKDIVVSFYELIGSEFVWDDIGATLWESVAGFGLGAALGLALAIPSGLSPIMRQMLGPYAVALQVTPRIAIAPLIIAWAGFGYNSKIWIAAIIAFFPVYVNALTGILTVDEDSREMFRSLGASRWQTFTHLMVPGSLPILFDGLVSGLVFGLIVAQASTRDYRIEVPWSDTLLHFVVPALAVIAWTTDSIIAVNPRVPWPTVGWVLVFPALWLPYTLVRGADVGWYPYFFLDEAQVGGPLGVAGYCLLVMLIFMVVTAALVGVNRWLWRRARDRRGSSPAAPRRRAARAGSPASRR